MLRSERPKLYTVVAFLSAKGLIYLRLPITVLADNMLFSASGWGLHGTVKILSNCIDVRMILVFDCKIMLSKG